MPANDHAKPPVGDRWLAAYGRAWENRDREAAAELFSADALYAWGPFDELHGRDAIRERWAEATAEQRDIRFRWEVLGSIGPTVVARWWCEFRVQGHDRHVSLDGIFLIELDARGLCTSFREWWAARETAG
ncbi:MAG TPA: nuclear transport factor 2 family protein [Solirubrobacterales bacterium]|nr:nuclear transport factor 2 family protein [Solirubrobacterales bacterium]